MLVALLPPLLLLPDNLFRDGVGVLGVLWPTPGPVVRPPFGPNLSIHLQHLCTEVPKRHMAWYRGRGIDTLHGARDHGKPWASM